MSTIKKGAKPEECAGELSAKIGKFIIENTRPVVEISNLETKIGTEWVIRLTVEPSQEVVGTHTNEVFIRSGASNRKPEPSWFSHRQLSPGGLSFTGG